MDSLLFLTLLLFPLALLLAPQAACEAAREGLGLCADTLLPALFPWFVLTRFAIGTGMAQKLGKRLAPVLGSLFHLSPAGCSALVLGLLGGYPVGGSSVSALVIQNQLSPQEGQRLLCFCNNAGPGFILSVAGAAVFHRPLVGLLLLLTHILSALLVGWVLSRGQRTDGHPFAKPALLSPPSALTRAVSESVSAALQVCAYVVLFQVFLGLLQALLPLSKALPSLPCALLTGLLELSGGVCALADCGPSGISLMLCAFLLGWGGLCVHCQTAALLEDSGLSLRPYLLAKGVQGLLAALLTGLGWLIFSGSGSFF